MTMSAAWIAPPLAQEIEFDPAVATESFIAQLENSVLLDAPLYQADTEFSLRSTDRNRWVELRIGTTRVPNTLLLKDVQTTVVLPSPARVGTRLEIFDARTDELLLAAPVQHLTYHRGNVLYVGNYGDSLPDLLDLAYLTDYVFANGPAPPNLTAADLQGDGVIDALDVADLKAFVEDPTLDDPPRADMLKDGTSITIRDLSSTGEESWNGELHAPPRKGEGAKPLDLDGDPKTPEWVFPCTFSDLGASALMNGYSTVITAWGPRGEDEGETPDGENTSLIRFLVCEIPPVTEGGKPGFSLKPIGKCGFPCGENAYGTVGLGGNQEWTSTDPDTGKAWKFEFDFLSCKIKISYKDGADEAYQQEYFGTPAGWSGWGITIPHVPAT